MMIYNWELDSGHQISVHNQGTQTTVTVLYRSTGTQQRTVSSISTGIWSTPPEISIEPTGATLKIIAANGSCVIRVRGNSIQSHCLNSQEHHSSTSSTSSSTTSSSSSSTTKF